MNDPEVRCESYNCHGHVELKDMTRVEWYNPVTDQREIRYFHWCQICRKRIFEDDLSGLSINGGGS